MVVKKTFNDFRDFITTGNLIAVAIGLLMGVQLGLVITSFTTNIFNPIFSMIGGEESLDQVAVVTINDAKFYFGTFFGDVISFVIIAFVAFVIVKISTKVFPPKPAGPSEVELLTEIRDALQK
jgi:large conductance mechanosensitive channel